MSRKPQSDHANVTTSSPALLLLVVVFALCFRGLALFYSLDSFASDPDDYKRLAINWHENGVFGKNQTPTAFRPPVYPLVLKTWYETVAVKVPHNEDTTRSFDSADVDRNEKTKSVQTSQRPLLSREKIALEPNAAIALLHWILGVGAVVFVYLLARRASIGVPCSCVAALLLTLDPILLQQSRLVMTETLATFCAALLLLLTDIALKSRGRVYDWFCYASLGAVGALASLCRPTFFLFCAFLGVVLLWQEGRMKKQYAQDATIPRWRASDAIRRLCVCILCGVAILAPWVLRNYRVFGKPILATTHGGYTLYLANNEQLYAHYASAQPWGLWNPNAFHNALESDYQRALQDAKVAKGSIEDEILQDKWTRNAAVETIKKNPQWFAYSCFVRFCELWRPLPQRVEREFGPVNANLLEYARYAVAVFYALELLLALLGAFKLYRRRKTRQNLKGATAPNQADQCVGYVWLAATCLLLSIQLPHLFYWTNMRMRAPLEVVVVLLVAVALQKQYNPNNPDNQNNQSSL
ncbi:MAG: glycosyltransferase family 39 protein [Planctomycetia bacterium]|nr:glycosyltransferase family 39 protein [Planctomycetia bacterium]